MDIYLISIAIIAFTAYVIQRYLCIPSLSIEIITHQGIVTKIATTTEQCIHVINEMKLHQPKVVGFDIEWTSKQANGNSNTAKVALLQLAHHNLIILIRMNLIQNIPGELHAFLGNVEILKVGVGIFNDKTKLKADYNLYVNGCVDLNHIFEHKLSDMQQNELRNICNQNSSIKALNQALSLKTFGAMLLKTEMKYKHMSAGPFHEHWDDDRLTTQHIHYAADDAFVGYKSFIQLMNIIQKNSGNTIHATEQTLNPYLLICDGFIDIKAIKSQKRKQAKNTSEKPVVKKRNKTVQKQRFIKPKFFESDDIYTLHNCNQLELKYNNLIQFHLSSSIQRGYVRALQSNDKTMNQCNISWKTQQRISTIDERKENKNGNKTESAFYCKCKDGLLYLNSMVFDTRIYVASCIDLKHMEYISIKTSIGANNVNVGAWNVGFVLGHNIFAYHPGLDRASGRCGAARLEGPNGWSTESMGFVPDPNKMQTFEILIDRNSCICLRITEADHEYKRKWKHKGSLFLDNECRVLIPCCFAIRIENSKGNKRNKEKRIGRFGDVQITCIPKIDTIKYTN